MEARLSAALGAAEAGEKRREKESEATALPVMSATPAGGMKVDGGAKPDNAVVERGIFKPADMPAETAAEEAVEEVEAVANGVTAVAVSTNPEDTNVWPTAAEEASFLSEARGRGEKVVPVSRAVAEEAEEVEEKTKALPKLEELVNRIPAETRELLDELFRVKFVAVRRVRKSDLKG